MANSTLCNENVRQHVALPNSKAQRNGTYHVSAQAAEHTTPFTVRLLAAVPTGPLILYERVVELQDGRQLLDQLDAET